MTSDLACLRAVGKDVAVPKPYPQEFRDDVVRVARDRGEGVTIEQVAKDFGVHPMTLHKWMRRADIDEGRSPGVSATESAELREARKRIRHHFSGSRFCPRCLAEPDCIWQRQWAHPLLPICLRHRLRLQTRCPGCGQVPFSDTTWLGRHGPPWHCANGVRARAPIGRCVRSAGTTCATPP
ncbi:transposase [Gordonia amicalis]|uniref:transposase n=1 Tax=Gordonia amicalis TaxID=89053 RepID=UPI003D15BD3B